MNKHLGGKHSKVLVYLISSILFIFCKYFGWTVQFGTFQSLETGLQCTVLYKQALN
jgi:hypothetical protein